MNYFSFAEWVYFAPYSVYFAPYNGENHGSENHDGENQFNRKFLLGKIQFMDREQEDNPLDQ